MNEDLLRTLMSDVDPVRDLSNEALDELVPFDLLLARVHGIVQDPFAKPLRERVSVWHRVSFRLSAAAAAVVLVASGSAAFLSSSPSIMPSGLAFGAVHSSWVLDSSPTLVKAPTPVGYEAYVPNALPWLVAHGRIKETLHLDGFTIAPAPPSIRPTVSAGAVAKELWATTALRGEAPLVFGYGDVTMTLSDAGVPKLHDVPVWIAIASAQPCRSKTACGPSHLASLPLTVVVSGYGLPNSSAKTGTPIAFVYQSAGAHSTAEPRLLPAILQASVAWEQDGPIKDRSLDITTGPFPCGALHGYNFVTGANGATLTVESLTPVSTLGDYCALSVAVRKVIPLTTTSNGATKWLIDPSARIIHAPTGPIGATR
jgi:hypothetical protein